MELVPELISELVEIARVLKWRVNEIDPDEQGDVCWVRGVILNFQNGSESVPFLLDADGVLRSMLYLMGHEDEFTKTISVKTQYGAVSDHTSLVNLLRHFKKQYFPDLEVSDEGGIWEGGSEEEFVKKKAFLDEALKAIKGELDKTDVSGDDISDELISIFEKVHRRMAEKRKKLSGEADQ